MYKDKEYSLLPFIVINKDKEIKYHNSISREVFEEIKNNLSFDTIILKKFKNEILKEINDFIASGLETKNIYTEEYLIKIEKIDDNYELRFIDNESHNLYESILDISGDIIIITNNEGKIVYINKQALIIKKTSFIDRYINDIVEIDIKKIKEELENKEFTSININNKINNTLMYLSLIIKKIRLNNKEYLLFSGKNITEIIEYQKILFEYLKNQTTTMQTFEILLKNKDISEIIEKIEKKLIKELGIKAIEVLENGKVKYSSTKTDYFYDTTFNSSLENKNITFRVYFDNVKDFFNNLNIKETLLYIFTNIFNTYEKLIFVNKLKEERDKAIRADKLKTIFLSNLTHEIRTPLNGILGFLQLIEREELKSELQDYINTIKESSERLIRNIENIIYLSKLESKEIKLKIKTENIEEIIDEVITKYEELCKKKSLSLEKIMEIDQDYKKLKTDKEKIKKILIEVLDNSVKFTDKGYVIIKTSGNEYYINISVEDTGIGIPENIRESIFEKFFQGDNISTKKHFGLGIGLSIVKTLCKILNSSIKVERDEKGTKIFIKIPRGF